MTVTTVTFTDKCVTGSRKNHLTATMALHPDQVTYLWKPPSMTVETMFQKKKVDPDLPDIEKIIFCLNNKLNFFLGGAPGTGKTTLVKQFTSAMLGSKAHNNPFVGNVPVLEKGANALSKCAYTGMAASHIDGSTLHCAFQLSVKSMEQDPKKVAADHRKKELMNLELQYVVCDEVSMISSDMLYWLDAFLRALYKRDTYFGGLCMIFVGDFQQLPPVVISNTRDGEKKKLVSIPQLGKNKPTKSVQSKTLTFETRLWIQSLATSVILTKNHRQSRHAALRKLLEEFRIQKISDESEIFWRKMVHAAHERYKKLSRNDLRKIAHVAYTNAYVNEHNAEMMESNLAEKVRFTADIRIKKPAGSHLSYGQVCENFRIKKIPNSQSTTHKYGLHGIDVKLGCVVVVTANNPEDEIFSGMMGVVVSIKKGKSVSIKLSSGRIIKVEVKKRNLMNDKNEIMATAKYISLKIGHASTIYGFQGVTISTGEKMVVGRWWVPPDVRHESLLVLLSRIQTPDQLICTQPPSAAPSLKQIKCNERTTQYMNPHISIEPLNKHKKIKSDSPDEDISDEDLLLACTD